MPTPRIVEPLDVIEHIGPGSSRVTYVLRAVLSVFIVEKKLSTAALSQQSPFLLMLQRTL